MSTKTIDVKIRENSRIPKYKQIVDSIINDISRGNLKVDQKIPSINELSESCYLSRDTVEKAYRQLKKQQVIISVKGKGYYIAKNDLISKVNVFFLINKPSSYKMRIYNSFVNALGVNGHVNLYIYHCEESLFVKAIEKNINAFDYYVIMPHFKDNNLNHASYTSEVITTLENIPKDKLILLDKYDKLILVYPQKSVFPYPKRIMHGFRQFCIENNFDFEILDEIYDDMELQKLDVYITIEESDLVNLVKQIREKNLKLGNDIGVISYNDTPLKELLGITVISTDFKAMGESAAYMVLKNKKEKV